MADSCGRRAYRGWLCVAGAPVAWLGRFCGPLLRRFRTPDRYENGLVIVLPGIESQSFFNHAIVWGVADGGWPGAIEIDDWTTTLTLLFPLHLRGWKRNQRQAERIAGRIMAYQDRFPGRPVYLIGHSGGGAMSVLILEKLRPERPITGAILLAAAISRGYPLTTALQRTEQGIWNFSSTRDWFFLRLGTFTMGTLDGRHEVSAGLLGFQESADLTADHQQLYRRQLHEVEYSSKMRRSFHLGGHFGCVNRVFVADHVAPLLMEPTASPD